MGKNTITVTIDETGESKSCTIDIIDIEFTNGEWTSDKEGKKPLERSSNGVPKSKLGKTVYFHLETKGLNNDEEIQLSLAEYDYNIIPAFIFPGGKLLEDIIDPDDRKFPEKEVVKKATVKNNKASIELLLHESWEGMIKDDSGTAQSNESIELYWEVSYNNKYKTDLPNDTDDYLRVSQNDRTLYFNMPLDSYNLPDMRSNDGSPLVYLKFMGGMAKGKLKDKALDLANNKIEKAIHRIALGKLEKGSLVTNTGRIQTNANAQIYAKNTYTNEGELLEKLKKRNNWGNATETTRGISQYDFFTKTGKRVKVLGFLKDATFNDKVNFFDVIDLFSYATDETDPFGQPLPDFGLGAFGGVLGSFTLVWNVAGLLVAQMKAEDDAFMREVDQIKIEKAKLEGLEAVRNEINTWNHNKDYEWDLLPISIETANKLLQGEFDTFEELQKYDFNYPMKSIEILYRVVFNDNKERDINIIETIFINE